MFCCKEKEVFDRNKKLEAVSIFFCNYAIFPIHSVLTNLIAKGVIVKMPQKTFVIWMVFIYQNTMEKKFVWRSLSCTRKSQFPSSKVCRCLFVRFSLKSSLLPSAGDSSGFLWFLPTNEQLVASYWCRRLWNSPQTSRCLQKLNRSYNLLSCHPVSDYLSDNSNWHNSVCRFLSPFVNHWKKKEFIQSVHPF